MRLSRWPDCYRIKLRKIGYRLVYKVLGSRMVIVVICIGRRDKDEAYEVVESRLGQVNDRS
jgi:mRNA interferase RelE/StbE